MKYWKGDYLSYGPGAEAEIYLGNRIISTPVIYTRATTHVKLEYTDEYLKKHPDIEQTIIDYHSNHGEKTSWANAYNPQKTILDHQDVRATIIMDYSDEELFDSFFDSIVESMSDKRNVAFFEFVKVDVEKRTLEFSW